MTMLLVKEFKWVSFGPLQAPRICVVDRFTVLRVYLRIVEQSLFPEQSVRISRENWINVTSLPIIRDELNYCIVRKKEKKKIRVVGKSLKRS